MKTPHRAPKDPETDDPTRWEMVYMRVIIWLALTCLLMWAFTYFTA